MKNHLSFLSAQHVSVLINFVLETRLELEMLEDLVQALSEKKSALVSLGANSRRDTTLTRSPTNYFEEK